MAFDVNPLVALTAVLIAVYVLSRVVASRPREMAADDPRQPYSVFTREFDVVCRGRDLGELLASSGTEHQFSIKTQITNPHKRREMAEQAYRSCSQQFAASISELMQRPSDAAITFLVDQSGSMANRMPMLAGQLKAAAEQIESLGIATAILGFTTVGWRGGKAREAWKQEGRPSRPGRLCALLHVVYKTFDEPMAHEDWEGFLRADLLRENVDGEALEWAVELLQKAKVERWILIVLSDGAPVDDSTLTENGSGFLWRHFLQVVAKVTTETSVNLGAIGVQHNVDDVYPTAISVDDVSQVPEALRGLLKRLLV